MDILFESITGMWPMDFLTMFPSGFQQYFSFFVMLKKNQNFFKKVLSIIRPGVLVS